MEGNIRVISPDRIDMPEQAFRCGSAAGYSLLAYLPQVIGAIFAQLIHPTAASIVLFARIFSLLFYVGAVYFCRLRLESMSSL